jgi:hypothetical protein
MLVGKAREHNVTYVAAVDTMELLQDMVHSTNYMHPAQCHRKLEEVDSKIPRPIGSYRYAGAKKAPIVVWPL